MRFGCIELTIPGRLTARRFRLVHARGVWNWRYSTVRAGTGERWPTHGTLADHATFNSLYAAYAKQVEFFAHAWCTTATGRA